MGTRDLATAALFGSFSFDFLFFCICSVLPYSLKTLTLVLLFIITCLGLRCLGGLSGASSPLQGYAFKGAPYHLFVPFLVVSSYPINSLPVNSCRPLASHLCGEHQFFLSLILHVLIILIFIRLSGVGRGGSSSSRGPQTSLSRATLTSSDGGILRRSQASVEI